MASEHEVLGCDECPAHIDISGPVCGILYRDIDLYREPHPPAWCPLRQGPITIRLKESTP